MQGPGVCDVPGSEKKNRPGATVRVVFAVPIAEASPPDATVSV